MKKKYLFLIFTFIQLIIKAQNNFDILKDTAIFRNIIEQDSNIDNNEYFNFKRSIYIVNPFLFLKKFEYEFLTLKFLTLANLNKSKKQIEKLKNKNYRLSKLKNKTILKIMSTINQSILDTNYIYKLEKNKVVKISIDSQKKFTEDTNGFYLTCILSEKKRKLILGINCYASHSFHLYRPKPYYDKDSSMKTYLNELNCIMKNKNPTLIHYTDYYYDNYFFYNKIKKNKIYFKTVSVLGAPRIWCEF